MLSPLKNVRFWSAFFALEVSCSSSSSSSSSNFGSFDYEDDDEDDCRYPIGTEFVMNFNSAIFASLPWLRVMAGFMVGD